MPENTFFWHDYETWGTSPKWDRASQFAGIRTDFDLNVIDKPVVMYCQPAADMLPHPEACLLTGITPQKAQAEGLCEADFFKDIHQQLARPGTCGVGYNSLRFDDEFTRYGFYRNFLDPYAREYQHGNSRWDLIDVVRLTRALRPEGIEWPVHEDGSPSFRLEQLTAANGIAHDMAHDALSDVYATIAMARLVREKQPRVYEFCLGLRSKQQAARYLGTVDPQPVLHVSRMIPARLGCISPVLPLAEHPTNRNAIIVYDLRHDPEDLLHAEPGELVARLFTPADQLPEGKSRIALKEVHLNKCPVLSPMNTLTDAAAEEWQIDLSLVELYRKKLCAQAGLPGKVREVYRQNVYPDETDVDGMLYSGFIPDSDKKLCEQILATPAEQLGSFAQAFADERLNRMLFLYRARNWPQTLNRDEQLRWQQHCRQRLQDPQDKYGISMDSFARQLARLSVSAELNEAQRQIIDALLDWPVALGLYPAREQD